MDSVTPLEWILFVTILLALLISLLALYRASQALCLAKESTAIPAAVKAEVQPAAEVSHNNLMIPNSSRFMRGCGPCSGQSV